MRIAPDRAGRDGGAGADFEFIIQQTFNTGFIHDQQNEIYGLSADLQSEAAAADGEVGGRPPRAFRTAATYQPLAKLPAEDEAPLFDRRKDRDALRLVEQFLRNPLVRGSHNLLEGCGGFLRAFAFISFGPLARQRLN